MLIDLMKDFSTSFILSSTYSKSLAQVTGDIVFILLFLTSCFFSFSFKLLLRTIFSFNFKDRSNDFKEQIQSEYGNIDIYSDNVDKENKLGQNFYKKFGFLCVDLPTDTIIDFDNIPKDDYDIVGILLPSDKLDECIERNDNQFPKIEFNGKTIDKNTYKKKKTNKMIRRW